VIEYNDFEVIKMKNIIKMLSANKDFRIVVADTYQIAEKELNDFTGKNYILEFLKQIITNCTLLSAMNDFNQKISFSLRLSKGISIFCMIANSKFSIEYTDKLNEFDGTLSDLFDEKSLLSITTGDWETGLHTGTVEAHIDNVDILFAYFTVQSEQLPSHFIMAGNNATRGLLMQPLPFADKKEIAKNDAELVYLSKQLEETEWQKVSEIYSHLAKVISESKIEV
jgi:redox-regulated HSP33 family molecular chaperone